MAEWVTWLRPMEQQLTGSCYAAAGSETLLMDTHKSTVSWWTLATHGQAVASVHRVEWDWCWNVLSRATALFNLKRTKMKTTRHLHIITYHVIFISSDVRPQTDTDERKHASLPCFLTLSIWCLYTVPDMSQTCHKKQVCQLAVCGR